MKSLVLFLFILIVTSTTFSQGMNKEEFRQVIEKAFADATKSAVLDHTGKAAQITIRLTVNSAPQTFQVEHDNLGVSSISGRDGKRINILRNIDGTVKGFLFPDGGRAIFAVKKEGDEFGRPGPLKIIRPGLTTEPYVSKISFKALPSLEDECSRAINIAGAQALAASMICSINGPGVLCAASLVSAAVAAYNAYQICNPEMQLN